MTKIDIFSGFLGAGKTTLIKKLIAEAYQGEQLVLIENEFGEIGIDGGFLKDSGVQINEMNSGCICCSLVGDFATALHQVIEQYHPDRILIEPSGVGKLSDVIRAVQSADTAGAVLNGFTTVADAGKVKMYMKNFGEFYNNQIEHASTIILSRTQGVKEDKLEAAVALLREHNAQASIITTPWDQLTGKQILAAMEQKSTLQAELEALAAEAEHEHHHHDHEDGECCCHDHDHDHEHEYHHHDHEDGECCCHDHDHDHEHENEHHHHDHEDGECSCGHHLTTTITMPTRFSPASDVRLPANLPMTRFCMRWKHWTTATNMALSCVPRALFRVKTDSGFILTMYPERRMSVMAVPRSSAVCA